MKRQRPNITVVVVSPKYQQNVGYIARISANFGVKKLKFVSPRCNILGKTAIKYSKAGRHLLETASTPHNFWEAIKGSFSIGTTGIWRKGSAATGSVYTLEDALKIVSKSNSKMLSLVLGRDDTGLRKEEIEQCNIVSFIPADPAYPVLNISHALAIMLYVFSAGKFVDDYSDLGSAYAEQKDKDAISRLFKLFVMKNQKVKNKDEVAESFNRVIQKSNPTKKELNSIAVAISPKNEKKR